MKRGSPMDQNRTNAEGNRQPDWRAAAAEQSAEEHAMDAAQHAAAAEQSAEAAAQREAALRQSAMTDEAMRQETRQAAPDYIANTEGTPVFQRPEYRYFGKEAPADIPAANPSAPAYWQNDSRPYNAPPREPIYPNRPANNPTPPGTSGKPPRKSGRTVGIIAVVLAVLVFVGAIAAGLIYLVRSGSRFLRDTLNHANPTVTTSAVGGATQATETPTARPTSRPTQTPGQTRVTEPRQTTTGANSGNNSTALTNPGFDISQVAGRQDPNKKALTTIEIAQIGKPAVVAITTQVTYDYFGTSRQGQSAGSGFIISPQGYIVTNFHVVEGARSISVVLDDGRDFEARLVGSDEIEDLAVLKIDGQDLPTVTLGDSDQLLVGELAVAIGNPLGQFSGSVTAGIISGKDREIDVRQGNTVVSMTLLQTDAAINSGNSGGALFNSFGEVVGINTLKQAATGVEGMGFAIPINHAKPLIETLIQGGTIIRPMIGVNYVEITEQQARQDSRLRAGIGVTAVGSGTPAQEAGIKAGDIIIAVNGQKVTTASALNKIKNNMKIGDKMTLTLFRDGREMDVELTLRAETTAQKTSSLEAVA